MTIITVTIRDLDTDEAKLSPNAIAIIAGVSEEQLIRDGLPKQLHRRAAEARAHVGDDLVEMVRYWARKDFGARVEFRRIDSDGAIGYMVD